MTREELIKHWDVIVAFKEGEKIQRRLPSNENWFDINQIDLVEGVEYRIKPRHEVKLGNIYRWGVNYYCVEEYNKKDAAEYSAKYSVSAIGVQSGFTWRRSNDLQSLIKEEDFDENSGKALELMGNIKDMIYIKQIFES